MISIELNHPKYIPKPSLRRVSCPACNRDVYLTMYTKIHCPCNANPYLNLVALAENLSEYPERRLSFHKDGK